MTCEGRKKIHIGWCDCGILGHARKREQPALNVCVQIFNLQTRSRVLRSSGLTPSLHLRSTTRRTNTRASSLESRGLEANALMD